MSTTATDALADLDAEIEGRKARRAEFDMEYRLERASMTAHLEGLESARRDLLRAARAERARGPLDPRKQAGRANIAAVLKAARAVGEATQAALASASGVKTGSMTWAIRALEQEGLLVATGERRGGSKVYRFVNRNKKRVLKPGEG